jgi:hypothetical protein
MRQALAIALYLCVFAASVLLTPGSGAHANELLEKSHWINFARDTGHRSLVNKLSRGSLELSDGGNFSLRELYSPHWYNLRLDFMTEVNDELAITWGLSTGGWGRKYNIDPSIKLGVIYQYSISEFSTVTFTAAAILGGRLREKSCVANYGSVGGLASVNCRLAASFLAPEDTLQYLIDKRPNDYLSSSIKYVLRF